MLNILRTNEDILMKLSVDLSNDVIVKFWWLHGRGTKSMVATPTLPRAIPLSNTLLKPQQKIKIFQKFFLHVFTWSQKLQKDIYNIFLSVILRDLKNFPGTFQSILFQVSLSKCLIEEKSDVLSHFHYWYVSNESACALILFEKTFHPVLSYSSFHVS